LVNLILLQKGSESSAGTKHNNSNTYITYKFNNSLINFYCSRLSHTCYMW